MPYFACFRMREGHQFRLDTRIYLRNEKPRDDDHCVAAIIGKNPGSANGNRFGCLAPISLDGDKLLPFVRNRFQNAYELAGVEIPTRAYVKVWNLFYLCNKDLAAAVKAYPHVKQPLLCGSESVWPPIVWFAWGPPKPHFAQIQARFLGRKIKYPFYYDMDIEEVITAVPAPASRVKHTQGMPSDPVEIHLASILRDVPRRK